jgi:hypothetical protein
MSEQDTITDAFGNRWDKKEWLQCNPGPNGEPSWATFVALTERIADLEAKLAEAISVLRHCQATGHRPGDVLNMSSDLRSTIYAARAQASKEGT